jgi:hypothetical protein
MRDAADKRKELEQQHAEALSQLRDKQSELQRLMKYSTSTSSEKKSKNYETIEALQVCTYVSFNISFLEQLNRT